jgi:hypothetical protein
MFKKLSEIIEIILIVCISLLTRLIKLYMAFHQSSNRVYCRNRGNLIALLLLISFKFKKISIDRPFLFL